MQIFICYNIEYYEFCYLLVGLCISMLHADYEDISLRKKNSVLKL